MKHPFGIALGLTVIAAGAVFVWWMTAGPGSVPPSKPPRPPEPREVARQLLQKWPTMNGAARRAAVPDMMKALQVEDEDVRLGVALAIDQAGKDAAPELVAHLHSPDAGVRYYAAWGLGRLGPDAKDAYSPLTQSLRDKNGDVRRKAAWAVVQLKPDPAATIPLLVALFTDVDIDVREAAADATATFGKAAVPQLLVAVQAPGPEVRRIAIRAIGAIGPDAADAIPMLRALLLDPDSGLQEESAAALAQMGKPAIPVLAAALKTDDRPMLLQVASGVGNPWAMAAGWRDPGVQRRQAIAALGKIGPDAIDVLLVALEDRYADVREQAASVLGSLGFRDRRIVQPLADRLADPDDSVRAQASWALNVLRPDARLLLPALKKAVKDDNVAIRLQTVDFLGKAGTAAVPLLLDALRDKDPKVQRQAVGALRVLDVDDETMLRAVTPLLKDDDATVRQYAVGVLHRCGPGAVPLLMTALKDNNESVRQQVVLALQSVGADEKLLRPALLEALKDGDPFVRAGTLGALTRFGPSAIPQLSEALKDRSPLVRKVAATALGRFDLKVAPLLIAALQDDDDQVWDAARKSLIGLAAENKKLLPLIVQALKSDNKNVRIGAAYVMERFGSDAVPYLVETMKDDPQPSVQWAAVDTIDTIGLPARKALLPLAEVAANPNSTVKMRDGAIAAMLKMHGLDLYRTEPVKAVPELLELLAERNATVRWSAALTLGAIGPPAKDAIPALTKALKDPSTSVSQTAQYALRRIQGKAE